jgi:hypothetical protein
MSVEHLEARTTAERLTRSMLSLVFETTVGSLQEAEFHAAALVRHADDPETIPTTAHQALRYASYPPRRSGDRQSATRRLMRAREIAQRHRYGHALFVIEDMLAGLCLDFGDAESALMHLDAAEEFRARYAMSFRRLSTNDTRALALAALGRWHEAREQARPAQAILDSGRCRAQFLGVAATLNVASHFGERAEIERCLESLDEVRDSLFRHAGQDLIAAAYASAIYQHRSETEAREFAHWYLSVVRRDRLPAPLTLTSMAT